VISHERLATAADLPASGHIPPMSASWGKANMIGGRKECLLVIPNGH